MGGLRSREQLLADCDIVVLPKPVSGDVAEMRAGQVLWGWPHCVPGRDADPARDRLPADADRLGGDEPLEPRRLLRPPRLPQEQRARRLLLDPARAATASHPRGSHGAPLRVGVVGFGATARGAVTALAALGMHEVSVLTQRQGRRGRLARCPRVRMIHLEPQGAGAARRHARARRGGDEGRGRGFLAPDDIVVDYGIRPDPDAPLTLVTNDELPLFERGTLFVDVSCDEGIGIEWARPTSFAEPTFEVGDDDHLLRGRPQPQAFLWDSATWKSIGLGADARTWVISRPADWESGTRRSSRPRYEETQRRRPEPPHPVVPAPRGGVPAPGALRQGNYRCVKGVQVACGSPLLRCCSGSWSPAAQAGGWTSPQMGPARPRRRRRWC